MRPAGERAHAAGSSSVEARTCSILTQSWCSWKWVSMAALGTRVHGGPFSTKRVLVAAPIQERVPGAGSAGIDSGMGKWTGVAEHRARLLCAPGNSKLALAVHPSQV